MSESYQSTKKTTTDTDPRTPRELFRDKITLSGFNALSTGYGVTGTYRIDTLLATSIIPDVRAVHYVGQGGGLFEWRSMPYSDNDINGNLRISTRINVENVIVGGGVEVIDIRFSYYTRENNIAIPDSAYYSQDIYFVVYSNEMFNLTA